MKKCALVLTAVLSFLTVPAFAYEKRASEIVACVNAKAEGLEGHRRDLASAFIEILPENSLDRFAEGFFLVHGLPFPGYAWGLILNGSSNVWVAHELKTEEGSERFPLVYVPSEVVEALAACDVAWVGVWQDELPIMERPRPVPLPMWQQLPENPLMGDGSSLLPPKDIDE